MPQNRNYKTWLQKEPRFNEEEAWPKSVFPDAEYTRFRDCGCLVCSLAVLLRHSGIEKTEEEELFNPWILNRRLIACGAFTPAADLELNDIQKLYPLQYMGAVPYSQQTLYQLTENDLLCLITVPGIRSDSHFLALLCILPEDALVFVPLLGERKLSDYAKICDIRAFRRIR